VIVGIQADSPVPPFEQIRAQIAARARDGRLPAGSRLPPVRRLADDLGLAVNTVARAYRELERDGVVVTRGRHGTFVTAATDAAERAAEEAAVEFARRVRQLGVPPETALRMARSALSDESVAR
jgi:DNA-binding transcriptional regulator YhcF (GntR family)